MKIKNIECNSITIYNSETNEVLAKITDDKSEVKPTIEIIFDIYTDTPEQSLVKRGDVLFYKDTPQETYIVTYCDNRLFRMCHLYIDNDENQTLRMNTDRVRSYPNNSLLNSLEDYGLMRLE